MAVPGPGPNLGLTSGYSPGANGWSAAINADLRMLDALMFLTVQQGPLNAAPAIFAQGARYIVGSSPTGFWSANPNCIAVYTTDETNTELWMYITPQIGMVANVIAAGASAISASYVYANGEWSIIDPADVVLTSAMFDSLFGSSVGEIIYRGSSGWEILSVGTEGQVLSVGASNALVWETPASGSSLTVSDAAGHTYANVSELFLEGGTMTGGAGYAIFEVSSSGTTGGGSYSAGSNITLSAGEISFNPSGLPVPFSIFAPGTLTANSQVIWSCKFPFEISAPGSLTGWQTELVSVAAAGNTTLTVSTGGTTVATGVISASGTTATWSASGSIVIPANQRFQLIGPPTPDTAAAGFETTLLFTRV